MKFTCRIRQFSSMPLAAACLMPLAALAGCSSLSLSEAVPAASVQPALAGGRPTQPDGYPNLNVPVTGASAQITNEEREQLVSELNTKRLRQAGAASSGATVSEAERLRLLARQSAEETLREIEATE